MIRLRDALGTSSDDFVAAEMDRIICAGAGSNEARAQALAANSALAVIDGIRPRDEVEAMLASQMAVTHALAMDLVARMRRGESLKECEVYGSLSVKLMRAYAVQVEALAKLRRGGEQKVTVEHVHVHEGGQAIVGHVSHERGGGGP